MINTKEEKKKLRKDLISHRDAMPESERLLFSEKITSRVYELNCYKNAQIIMIYVSFGSEVNTIPLIQSAIKAGKTIITPICNADKTMLLAKTKAFPEGFIPTNMGILELDRDKVETVEPEELDLIITPGVSFTVDGKRLGYGGGYYDRLFLKTREDALKICPCFEAMISEDLPIGVHDKIVDMIITENRVLKISK